MKQILLSLATMLTVLTASASAAGGTALRFDSLVFRGNGIAELAQFLEVGLHNVSDSDLSSRFYLLADNHTDGKSYVCLDTLVNIEAHHPCILRMYCHLPEGDLTVRLATGTEGAQTVGSVEASIRPFKKLDIGATFSLDMLSERNGEHVLYGSHIRGWVGVENNDDVPFHGTCSGKADDGIVLFLEDSNTKEQLFTRHIADMLWQTGKADGNFCYDAVFRDGARYALKAAYSTVHGLELIDSLCFTTISGTNTYWTADGAVIPLPEGDDRQLLVPEAAVAVDLRGQHLFSTAFSVDVSQANPNCLFYLDMLDKVPAGLDDSRNLVRGLEATNIKLTEHHDYFCPLAFHTRFISYIMTPSYDNADDELRARGYSETIVLPFKPSYVNLYDINGGSEMLHADMLKVLRYYGNQGDSINVSVVGSPSYMLPYEPYILGVYIGSSLLFIGEDTNVPMTCEAIVRGNDFNLVGTTVRRQLAAGAYLYDAVSNSFSISQDSAWVAPFHAYMNTDLCADYDELYIADSAWGDRGKPGDATAISDTDASRLPSLASPSCCDLSGRRIVTLPASRLSSLRKGIYIMGGRKIIVK